MKKGGKMEKLIELNIDSNIVVSSKVINIKNPEYVYIPILPNSKLLVSKSKKVKIGTPLISHNYEIFTSPISGVITDIKKISTINSEEDALEIKNDFEEACAKESKVKKNILNIKKEVLDKALALFKINLINKKYIVLNCIDDDPYTLTESFYLFKEYTDFLEVLDKLSDIYKLQISIAVKASNNFSINELINYLGMYPNIKLEIVPNLYLLGSKRFLLKQLNLTESDTAVIKGSSFYHLSNFLKRGRLKTDKLITISGDNIEVPSVIKTKIGTPINKILKAIKEKNEESVYFGNSLMNGKEVTTNNLIVTDELSSVIIMKKETINKSHKKEAKCINCGLCIDICPVGINPLLLKNEKYYQKCKDRCLGCGLCSYICPVYINFNCSNRKGETNE